MRKLLPGLVLCLIAGAVSAAVNLALPEVSALLVAILLGVVVGNVVRLPESLRPGIAVSAKRVLRIGIVLLGLQVALKGLTMPVASRLYRLGLFWHFLDIAWVGIFSIVYLPGLL